MSQVRFARQDLVGDPVRRITQIHIRFVSQAVTSPRFTSGSFRKPRWLPAVCAGLPRFTSGSFRKPRWSPAVCAGLPRFTSGSFRTPRPGRAGSKMILRVVKELGIERRSPMTNIETARGSVLFLGKMLPNSDRGNECDNPRFLTIDSAIAMEGGRNPRGGFSRD